MEIDYNAVFGIEDTGATEQEPAAPAGTDNTAAGADTEVTEDVTEDVSAGEPAGGDDTDGAEDLSAGDNAGTAQKSATEQSPEERARYAAARRKAEAERDAAVAKAREDAQRDVQRMVDEAFASSGMVNPYTGQAIRSKADFDEYQKTFSQNSRNSFIQKAGISDTEFQQFIESLPEVRAAKQAQLDAEKVQREAAEARAKVTVDEQLAEIGKIDPEIKTIEDLTRMPTYTKFYELVQKGNSFVDAYKLANFDTLTTKAQAAAKQQAITNARSKDHLTPRTSRGTGQDAVPADIIAEYRQFMPDATVEEITRHYNAYKKSTK